MVRPGRWRSDVESASRPMRVSPLGTGCNGYREQKEFVVLVYMDESGHPHPNDPSSRPVVVAACIQERDARRVAGRLHGIKRDVLGRERMEMKGSSLINRPTFRRRPDMVAFVEEFFSALLNLPITVFAVIMERPAVAPDPKEMKLPDQFRFLDAEGPIACRVQ